MMAMLRNVDGFNYLENKEYKVDGYGTHLYPPRITSIPSPTYCMKMLRHLGRLNLTG